MPIFGSIVWKLDDRKRRSIKVPKPFKILLRLPWITVLSFLLNDFHFHFINKQLIWTSLESWASRVSRVFHNSNKGASKKDQQGWKELKLKFNQSHIQIVSSLNYSKSLKFKFFDVTRYITASPESRTALQMSPDVMQVNQNACVVRFWTFFRTINNFLSLKWTFDMKSFLESPVHKNRCDLKLVKT